MNDDQTTLWCSRYSALHQKAAIVHKRRLDVVCLDQDGESMVYQRVLPLDIQTREGNEWLTVMYADVAGDIRRVDINTAELQSFQAVDEQQPRLWYQRT